MILELLSPVGAKPILYSWPLTSNQEKYSNSRALDILETIKWVGEDFPEAKSAIKNNILRHYDENNYENIEDLVKRFNNMILAVVRMEKGTTLPYKRLNKYPSQGLLKHILQQVYNRAVEDPEKLNQYEPFSPEVYGETSYDFVCQMIDLVKITPDDVFIDLGSGVGQVVLQMAGGTPCKLCIGIERAKIPNEYADNMNKYFRDWMQWYGKKFGEYKLIKDDFLLDKYRETIFQASIIFVNNFAFGPNVDHQLKELFATLKDGTRIVSSRSFCSMNSRITSRTVDDISSIMDVYEMPTMPGSVSWTGKPVPYYLHIINRLKLLDYFERLNIADTDSNSNASICSSDEQIKEESDSDFEWECVSSEKKKLIKNIFVKQKTETGNKQQKKCRGDQTKILPAATEYVDQELPITSTDTAQPKVEPFSEENHNALENLLDVYRTQFIQMLQTMKSTEYKNQIESEIIQEKERNQLLQNRASQLEEEIKELTENSVVLMKARMNELDLNVSSSRDLENEVNQIVCRNKELQDQANTLEEQINQLEKEQVWLVEQRQEEIAEKYRKNEPNITVNKELILREVAAAFDYRVKLQHQISKLENEIIDLTKTNEKRQQVEKSKLGLEPKHYKTKMKKSKSLLRSVLEKNSKKKDSKKIFIVMKKNEMSNEQDIIQNKNVDKPKKKCEDKAIVDKEQLVVDKENSASTSTKYPKKSVLLPKTSGLKKQRKKGKSKLKRNKFSNQQ